MNRSGPLGGRSIKAGNLELHGGGARRKLRYFL